MNYYYHQQLFYKNSIKQMPKYIKTVTFTKDYFKPIINIEL